MDLSQALSNILTSVIQTGAYHDKSNGYTKQIYKKCYNWKD